MNTYPIVHAQIEPTTYCNFQCPKCLNVDLDSRRRGHLGLDDLKMILDRMPFIKDITFCGMGETFMNPEIMLLFQEVSGRGIIQRTTTNASLIHKFPIECIMGTMEKIHISFDAAAPDVFEKLRPGANFQQVVQNIRTLVCTKQKHGYSTIISMNCVITRDGLDELEHIPKLAKELGFDCIAFVCAVQLVGVGRKNERIESMRLDDPSMEECLKRKLRRLCNENNLGFSFADSTSRLPGCWWPQRGIYITHDGYLTPCCLRMNPDEYNFGSILEESFDNLWNSETYRSFRVSFENGNYVEACLNCPG